MRKITLCAAALFLSFTCKVQSQTPFPDGGFENCWEYFELKDPIPGKGAYWDVKRDYFLSTLNVLYELTGDLGEAPLTAWQLTDGVHSGDYALKLTSNTMTMGEQPIFLPGVAGTLSINFVPVPECILGKPFTSRPVAVKGWFKYEPVNGDSAAIELFLLESDGYELGAGKRVIHDSVSEWTEFTIPVSYSYDQTPSDIVVIFTSSANYDFTDIHTLMECKGQNGSTLYLDDIEFVYEAGIKEMLAPEISMNVFPNPSTEQITVQTGKEVDGTVKVYDYLSRKVGEYPVSGTQTTIDISDFATGSYLINVMENEKVITTGRFIKQ